ncbi:YidB family protein, partial [Mesorhizobium sp. M2C.T.Ca.TU.002.02.1.1]|uniref:YidB family protein n=1 Tax=Mesorhizobium sp. M2C.T.Ca.TU.002.02.1.1 TaxID=2496788 RepID=UPI002479EE79
MRDGGCDFSTGGSQMGFLDSLQSALQGGQQGGGSNLLADALTSVGGYQGVLAMLQKSGLGDRVESWLSTNASNLPIAPDEIKAALGDQRLQQLASQFGIPLDQLAGVLAQH